VRLWNARDVERSGNGVEIRREDSGVFCHEMNVV